MIQRIQSLYLVLALVACILTFFFPFASYISDLAYYQLTLTGFKHISPDPTPAFSSFFTLPLLGLHLVAGFLILFVLVSYKNRLKQLKILRFTFLFCILYIGLLFFYTNFLIEKKLGIISHYNTGSYFPLIMLAFIMLANRAIGKDEKLIRSMDRLR